MTEGEMRGTIRAVAQELREWGDDVRYSWADFDGRVAKREMYEFAERLEAILPSADEELPCPVCLKRHPIPGERDRESGAVTKKCGWIGQDDPRNLATSWRSGDIARWFFD